MQRELNEKLFFAKIRLFEAIGKLSINGIGLSTTFLDSSGAYLTSTRHPDICRAFTKMRHMDQVILQGIHRAGRRSYDIKQPLLHRFGLWWFVTSAIDIKGHECTLAIGPFTNICVPLPPHEGSDFSRGSLNPIAQATHELNGLLVIDPSAALEHAKTLTEITHMLLEELTIQEKLEKQLSDHQEYIKQLLFDGKTSREPLSTFTDCMPSKTKTIALEKEYISHIQTGNKEMANKLVNDVLEDLLSKADQDLDRFKANAYELLAILIRAAIHSGVPSDVMTDVIDMHYHFMKSETNCEEIHLMISEATNTLSNAIYQIKGNSTGRSHLSKAILFIRKNYHKPVALDEVARVCDISSYYLSHLFRDEMETTYVEYVNKVRLDEAKKLLQTGDYTIYQAAYHCGFRDPGYFSKTFKRYLGVTPRKYQQIIQR
ncbi:MAG: AraC family transcriptional regulator [Candidatus Izemoplasmatales bacterium]|nr:AraC family transcriptional regulator [Candidatus Izemoplasmatales bacterium]